MQTLDCYNLADAPVLPPAPTRAVAVKTWETHSLSHEDRFAYWREVLCEAFTALSTRPSESGDNGSKVVLHELADVNAANLRSFAQTITRGKNEIRRRDDTYFFANMQVSGKCHVEQDGRYLTAEPGNFYLVDTTRPYRLDFVDPFQTLSFRIPVSLMSPLIGDPRSVTARQISGRAPFGELAISHMRALMRCTQDASPQASLTLSETLAQLIGLAVSDATPADGAGDERAHRAFQDAIVRYVAKRSLDPNLSVKCVAARFRISPRTIQSIFAERGTTFSKTVLEQRLKGAASALAQRNATVTQAALDNGFGDLTYFGRAFRARYGCTSREWMKEQKAQFPLPS
ncbi:helix-turn-helix domain-containing protein [Paracoccus limosus]|uniref:Helix-turn-helix domain-containing protein n=1 Tax=Paracoccus limosus TaxID=913252 RepID=A0A844H7L1_9RHOB|nr:helix-turn-helix domain-containing protein [Paracoccus limosus]MTH34328.1 helix-turn-helix domain-containing protein [Paracoccus limosus]